MEGNSVATLEIAEVFRHPDDDFPGNILRTTHLVLQELERLGVIESSSSFDDLRWRCSADWNRVEIGRDQGGDMGGGDGGMPPGGGGPAAPGDQGGDNGSGGIAEVLAHPVLFSLSEADFEAMLRDTVGESE